MMIQEEIKNAASRNVYDIYQDGRGFSIVDHETGEIVFPGVESEKKAREMIDRGVNWCCRCYAYRCSGATCGDCGDLLV